MVQKNVELELQLESIRKALIEATEDSSGVEQLKQEALAGYDIFKASVINNSVTHADNYLTDTLSNPSSVSLILVIYFLVKTIHEIAEDFFFHISHGKFFLCILLDFGNP